MTDRVAQLSKIALDYAAEQYGPQRAGEKVWDPLTYDRKFAELIVLECMHECLRMQLGNQYTPEELLFQTKYRKIIKEHFGVQE